MGRCIFGVYWALILSRIVVKEFSQTLLYKRGGVKNCISYIIYYTLSLSLSSEHLESLNFWNYANFLCELNSVCLSLPLIFSPFLGWFIVVLCVYVCVAIIIIYTHNFRSFFIATFKGFDLIRPRMRLFSKCHFVRPSYWGSVMDWNFLNCFPLSLLCL